MIFKHLTLYSMTSEVLYHLAECGRCSLYDRLTARMECAKAWAHHVRQ